MNNRREQIQRQMTVNQIREINKVVQQLQDALDVAEMCNAAIVVIGRPAATRAIRNLQDFEKRFLVGQI